MSSDEANKMVLHDICELLENFEKGWTYPHRPMMLNEKYRYKLLYVGNPDDFSIQIDDRISSILEAQIKTACNQMKKYVESTGFNPIGIQDLKDMLPVAVKDDEGNYLRGEINCVNFEKNEVNVFLVDKGEDKWVPINFIFPPSIDMLRFPKLTLMCRLAQVVPYEKAAVWKQFDYRDLFQGKESSLFSISLPDRGMYEVYLECDGMDVGYDMVMNKGLADFVPLGFVENDEEEKMVGKYPRNDFTDWLGQKIAAYGTKVSRVGKSGRFKVHLQLDTNLMDKLWEKINALPEESRTDFPKEVGDPVIVRYGADGDLYRATIIQKSKIGYLVKLVDYGDFVNIEEKDMQEIPDDLVQLPEAATPCYIVEMLQLDEKDLTDELKDKLCKLIMEKDVVCRIGHSNFVDLEDPREVRKYLVSLSTVKDDATGQKEQPFYEILNIPNVDLVHYYTNSFPTVSQSLAFRILGGNSTYFMGRMYEGIVSYIDSHDSVWLHLTGDDSRCEELTNELTDFYQNWRECPRLDAKSLVVGTYVGSQQTSDPTDLSYYRARITYVSSDKKEYSVLFLDYGNNDVVTIDKIKPLPNYFIKDKCFALQVALPVELLPGAGKTEEDAVYEIIFKFTDGLDACVYLQHENGVNYAWVFVADNSLTTALIQSGLVKLKIQPNDYIPTQ